MRKHFLVWLLGLIFALNGSKLIATPVPLKDFNSQTTHLSWDAPGKLGTVLIFMSAVCPCSQSHEPKIASLIRRYPEFQFVGVHSNLEEEPAFVKAHFEKAAIPFLTLAYDRDHALANQFGALKTPHVFLVDRTGKTVYRGGVDNSHTAEKATREYLENALSDLKNGRPVALSETKPLGCVISR